MQTQPNQTLVAYDGSQRKEFTMEYTFTFSTDNIWEDNDPMPRDYPETVANRMAGVLTAWYPDVEFDYVIDRDGYEHINPAVRRDNDEVREVYPAIDDEVNRAYHHVMNTWQ